MREYETVYGRIARDMTNRTISNTAIFIISSRVARSLEHNIRIYNSLVLSTY